MKLSLFTAAHKLELGKFNEVSAFVFLLWEILVFTPDLGCASFVSKSSIACDPRHDNYTHLALIAETQQY